MNEWQLAAAIMIAALLPCLWTCARKEFADGLAALELAGMISAIALLLLSEGEGREPFADLAIVLAVLSFVGSLFFARFLERSR